MENNSLPNPNNNTNNSNVASEIANLQAMMGGSTNSNPSVNNNGAEFDNSSVVITTDEDEDEKEERFNELVGTFDQPKKTTNLSEDELLLADPNLVPKSSTSNTNNINNGNSPNNVAGANNANNGNEVPQSVASGVTENNPQAQATNPVIESGLMASGNAVNASSGVASSDVNSGVGLPNNLLNNQMPAGNNVLATVKPKGNWNQRIVVFSVCAGILLLTVIFHNTSGKTNPKGNGDEIARTLPPPEASPRMADSNLRTYELGMPDGKLPSGKRIKEEEPLPQITIPKEVPPAPVVKNEPTPKPIAPPKVEEIEEPEDFAIKFRAANKLAAESLVDKDNNKKEAKEAASILEGLRIPMQLIEPLRSGIPTNVSAVVIADVKDGEGSTVVPKGSRVQIPFLAFEVQGRVSNDIGGNTIIVLPNNKKLAVKGTVKGTDGFAGLKGKVKQQSKGNILARTSKAITRVGARVIGLQTGGVGGFVIEDTINQSVNTSLPFVSNERVVEVMAGTPFTFNVN